jgi:hypothetical protein
MSEHCCSCNPPKVVVNCSGSGIEPKPQPEPNPQPQPQPEPKPGPQPEPQCRVVRVDFVALRVTEDGDTGAGDWTLVLEANGIQQIKVYPDDYIDQDDNIPYDIGVSINVPIESTTNELSVKISGYERDGFANGENDALPIASRIWSRSTNFGIGQAFDVSAANKDAAYAATIRISCATQSTAVFSKAELIASTEWRTKREINRLAKHNKPAIERSDANSLNAAIGSLRQKGWVLKTVSDGIYFFEGFGRTPTLRLRDPRIPAIAKK